jgi:hypothetical protein
MILRKFNDREEAGKQKQQSIAVDDFSLWTTFYLTIPSCISFQFNYQAPFKKLLIG